MGTPTKKKNKSKHLNEQMGSVVGKLTSIYREYFWIFNPVYDLNAYISL